jgi:hypothetical protein
MALTNIVDEVVILVKAVPNIGKVYGYHNHVDTEAEVKEKYRDATGIIHAWIVTRGATAVEDAGNHARHRHKIYILGYRSVQKDPDSEQKHQDLTELVRAIFDAQGSRHLPNLAGWVRTPIQVEDFGARVFSDIGLCWYAVLSFEVEQERIGS